MQGLLLLADAPQSSNERAAPVDLAAVHEAFAQAHSESFADTLANQLGAEPTPAGSGPVHVDLVSLLAAGVGAEHAFAPGAFDFTQTVEEAQAMAAA